MPPSAKTVTDPGVRASLSRPPMGRHRSAGKLTADPQTPSGRRTMSYVRNRPCYSLISLVLGLVSAREGFPRHSRLRPAESTTSIIRVHPRSSAVSNLFGVAGEARAVKTRTGRRPAPAGPFSVAPLRMGACNGAGCDAACGTGFPAREPWFYGKGRRPGKHGQDAHAHDSTTSQPAPCNGRRVNPLV